MNRIALLWQLAWKNDRVSCAVYKAGKGLEMRLEAGRRTLYAEPFEIGPRMVGRVQALRRSLLRRGWEDPTT
jgi:hypothetical protein